MKIQIELESIKQEAAINRPLKKENMQFSQIIRIKAPSLKSNNKRSRKPFRKIEIITQEKRIREHRKFIICINMQNSTETLLKPTITNQHLKSMVTE